MADCQLRSRIHAPGARARVQSFSTEVGSRNYDVSHLESSRSGHLPDRVGYASRPFRVRWACMECWWLPVRPVAAAVPCPPERAYPGVSYAAEVPLLLSEIDPAQNRAVDKAVGTAGFSESATYGPYESGPVASINLTSPGSGYTTAPTVTFTAPGAAPRPRLSSIRIQPVRPMGRSTRSTSMNGGATTRPLRRSTSLVASAAAVVAVRRRPRRLISTANGSAHCSGGASACYPPVVNYTPLYYLINGVAFDKTNAMTSLFAAVPGSSATPVTGNVLVRFVNAGCACTCPRLSDRRPVQRRPSRGFSLIAEDGNPLPGLPRVQSEVFMAAGKTYDVMINAPAAGGSACLSLTAN